MPQFPICSWRTFLVDISGLKGFCCWVFSPSIWKRLSYFLLVSVVSKVRLFVTWTASSCRYDIISYYYFKTLLSLAFWCFDGVIRFGVIACVATSQVHPPVIKKTINEPNNHEEEKREIYSMGSNLEEGKWGHSSVLRILSQKNQSKYIKQASSSEDAKPLLACMCGHWGSPFST